MILVTGANGFVGRHLCRNLAAKGYRVRGSVRADPPEPRDGIEYVATGDLGGDVNWGPMLEGIDAVVHAAARVHQLTEKSNTPNGDLDLYHRINVTATAHLAQQAHFAGVRRFVLLSTIKASGVERAEPDPAIFQRYEMTKREAELALHRIVQSRAMDYVILRPPLVYGPDAVANFALLARTVAKGLPLPLASIRNRRSFIHVGNLCSAIETCLEHPKAGGEAFELSDGPPVSTPDFVRAIGRALGRPAWLLPCPPALLRALGKAIGRGPSVESLTSDLVADDGPIRTRLGWRPPLAMDDALAATFAKPAAGAP